MLTLLLLSSFLVTCTARAANDVAAQPRNMGRDPQYKRVCYYTNWSQYRKQPARYFPFNIDPFLCTHLIFAFAKVDYKGQLAPYEWNDIQYPHLYKQFTGLKKKNPHLKTLLAVGGWTHGSRPFTDMVKTKVGRKSFIDQSLQYLRAHNFDGLDLDWEYPANRGSPEEDKKKFSLLVMEMHAAYAEEAERTGKERLLVTAAVGGGEKIVRSAYEVPVINKYLDFINLMSYDLHGSWSKVLGINAPLYASSSPDPKAKTTSVDEVVQLWLDLGASPSKLVMGIPTYGRSFTLCSEKQIGIGDRNCGPGSPAPYTRERGFVSYYEMSENLKQGWTRVWLDDQMVPFAYSLRNKQWVGYDDIQSVQLKAQYIKHHNLAGAMVWAVDLDDFGNLAGRGEVYPLCKAIREVLEDADYPVFTPPPKLATTEERPKVTGKKPDKEAYKKESGVTKDRSSQFNNMNTVRKSPFLPPSKKTDRPMTSPLMSSKTSTNRPTAKKITKSKYTTTKATRKPSTTSRRLIPPTTQPTTMRVAPTSRRFPYRKRTSTRPPSIFHRRKMPTTKTPTTSRTTHRQISTESQHVRTENPKTSTAANRIPTSPRSKTTPSLPPVLTSSPKYPQWEPVVITTKGIRPTDFATLKKSSKDLKKTDVKNTSLSRKIGVKKQPRKRPMGVDHFGPKPTPGRSPYTPPPHLKRKSKTLKASSPKNRPTYKANPKFPAKQINDGLRSIVKKKTKTMSVSSTSEPSRYTTLVNVRRVTKPLRVNAIQKPEHEVYDSESIYDTMDATTNQITSVDSFTPSTEPTQTTALPTSTARTSTKQLPKWKPPYSFKPWKKTTRGTTAAPTSPMTTTATTTTTTTSTSIPVSTTIPTVSTTTATTTTPTTASTTIPTTKPRPQYSFRPWSKTTRRATPATIISSTVYETPTTTTSTTTSTPTATTIPTLTPTTLSSARPSTEWRSRYPSTTLRKTTMQTRIHMTTPRQLQLLTETTANTATTTNADSTTATATTTTTSTTSTTSTPTKKRWRPRYSFKPWSTSTKPTVTSTTAGTARVTRIREALFKPKLKALAIPTKPPITSLPEFRPWTKRSKTFTTTGVPSTTKAFFLFAKISSSTPSIKAVPTSSTRQRLTTRVRSTARSKQPSTLTPSDIINIIKEKTFPGRKPTEASKTSRQTTTTRTTKATTVTKGQVTSVLSTTPDLRARADGKFVAATWTSPAKTSSTTIPTTSINATRINVKPNDHLQESDYRKVKNGTIISSSTSIFVKSSTPSGPQNIFAWMTPVTSKSPTSKRTKTTSITTPSTTKRRTLPIISTVTQKPTTQVIVTTSKTTTTAAATTTTQTTSTATQSRPTSTSRMPTRSTTSATIKSRTHQPLTTHSFMEAGLGLDHTHPSAKLSPLRKNIRQGFVRTKQGIKFTHKPLTRGTPQHRSRTRVTTQHRSLVTPQHRSLTRVTQQHRSRTRVTRPHKPLVTHTVTTSHRPLPRVTPPPVVTLPTRTERPYVMSIPRTSDCDHSNDDIRDPDIQTLNRQRQFKMNTDYVPPRRKAMYKQTNPKRGYIKQNLKANVHQRYEETKDNYNVHNRLNTWPRRLVQPNVRYNLPPRRYNGYREHQQQIDYNVPSRSEEQHQTIVVDYKYPNRQYHTIEQTLQSKSQERNLRIEATDKENNMKIAIPEFKCPSVFGIFPDRTDCRKFYQCVWFVPFHHMCGKGTVWNDVMKICDWPQAVSSCLT